MRKSILGPILGLFVVAGSLVVAAPASAFTLHNFATNFCLGVAAANKNPGAALVVWPCDGTDNQQWSGTLTEGAGYSEFFTSVTANRLLAVTNGKVNNGSPIIDQTETGSGDQFWEPVPIGRDFNGNACFYFRNFGGDGTKVMGVSGGNRNKGTAVIIWDLFLDANGLPDWMGHPDQFWCAY